MSRPRATYDWATDWQGFVAPSTAGGRGFLPQARPSLEAMVGLCLAALMTALVVLGMGGGARLAAVARSPMGAVTHAAADHTASQSSAPAGHGALPAGLGEAAAAAVGATATEYHVRAARGGLAASGGGLSTSFGRSAVSVATGTGGDTVSFHTSGSDAHAPLASANRVTYERGGIREWYANGPLGLEQGFTVAEPPVAGAPLTVTEQLTGGLVPQQAGQTVEFSGQAGGPPVLRYTDLHAVDATGRALPARLELTGRTLRLLVDANGARYPVTIDPMIEQAPGELTPSDGSGAGQFGSSVALSADGNTALIGAPQELTPTGGAWVFTRSAGTWSQQATLSPTNVLGSSGAQFGQSVALSANGDTAIVGGPNDNDLQGAVWIYTRSAGVWSLQTKVHVPADQNGTAEFGWSVSMSADGSVIAVGGPQDNGDPAATNLDTPDAGAVWIIADVDGWIEQSKLTPAVSPASGISEETDPGQFGYSVSLSGNAVMNTPTGTVVIGAPFDLGSSGKAWVFANSAAGWNEQGALQPSDELSSGEFGFSTAISNDGQTALIGGPLDDPPDNGSQQGSAWTFTYNPLNAQWLQQSHLTAPAAGRFANFGTSVALASDGSSALIGSPNDGATGSAWMFATPVTSPSLTCQETPSGTDASDFGAAVALSSDGSTEFVGAPFSATGVGGNEGSAFAFVPGACVSNESASALSDTTIEVLGTVDPNGADTTYSVEYGPTPAYGQSTAAKFQAGTAGPASVDETIGGLQPGTLFHYRIDATTTAGTSLGADETVVSGRRLTGRPGSPVSGVLVSGSGCPDTGISIDWGDGSQPDPSGTVKCGVVGDASVYTVTGSHVYAATGHYPVQVTLTASGQTFGAGALIMDPRSLAVTTTSDDVNDANCQVTSCTLRQAVNAANVGSGADTITVPAGSYQLNSNFGALTVTSGMTIDGAGARTTTILGEDDRVYDVAAATDPVVIQGVTLFNGLANQNNGFFGGDVRSRGDLTLREDTISGGHASSGGGVSNFGGTMLIDRSTISNNSADSGGADSGGVQNWGDNSTHHGALTIRNSTIASNVAGNGGGVFQWNDTANTLVIENSTIADNLSTANQAGGLEVTEGAATVQNTIIAGNQADGESDCHAVGPNGSITSLGNNLNGNGDCGFAATGDLSNTDPLLGALANNGGPTDTMALPAGSPAVDAGSSNCPPPAVDQRGVARPGGAACDIGAFELAPSGNDDFANAFSVSGASGSTTGINVAASTETGEPGVDTPLQQAQVTTGSTLWWKWQAPSTGSFVFDTLGSDFDTTLAVFTGSSVDSLTEIGSNDNNNANGSSQSLLGFHAISGTTYYIQVGSLGDRAQGNINLDWATGTANDSFEEASAIPGSNGSLDTTLTGATFQLNEPDNGGNSPFVDNTLWYAWTPPTSGPVTVTASANFGLSLGVYTGTAIDSLTLVSPGNNVDSNSLTVGFTATANTTYYIQVGTYDTPPGPVTLSWSSSPDAPTGVSAAPADSQATVSFAPPASDGGSAITSYTVTASPGGATASGAGSPIVVTGLTNGTAYTFTVTATNAIGTGPASAPSSPVTPGTVPGAPTGVSAVPGDSQATVSFTAPASDGGSAITSYTVTASPGGATGSGVGSPIVVSGLTNGTAYTFTVTATNGVGTGAASAPSGPVTPVGAPGAPTGASATAGDAQATVSFTPPAANGGSAITSYTVTAAPGGATASGAGSPIVVSGLTNGTAYTFTVTATNAVGTGAASAPSTAVTPAAPPVAVPPTVPSTSDTSAAVATSINPNGSPTTYYVEYGPSAAYGQQTSPVDLGSGATSVPVNVQLAGLAPSTTYHYRFVTTNAKGTTFTTDATFTTAAAAGGGGGGAPPPPPPPPPPPTPPATPANTTASTLPPPVQNKSIDILPYLGTVLVNGKLLTVGMNIPFGATVDATHGTVILESDNNGVIERMQFTGGVFKLFQLKDGTTQLVLQGGDFSVCKATHTVRLAENARTVRHLWGNGKGHFQTKGRYAAATVRGTIYLVADRCDGTFIKVVRGVVTVDNFVTHKATSIKAGKTYLAKPKAKP